MALCIYLRKLGDSNPRYGYPYGSLANYWFQPLTQTSFPVVLFENLLQTGLKCGAKVLIFPHTAKSFDVFFQFFFS